MLYDSTASGTKAVRGPAELVRHSYEIIRSNIYADNSSSDDFLVGNIKAENLQNIKHSIWNIFYIINANDSCLIFISMAYFLCVFGNHWMRNYMFGYLVRLDLAERLSSQFLITKKNWNNWF